MFSALIFAAVAAPGLRFEVSLDPKLNAGPGRLVVAVSKSGRPRFTDTDAPGQPLLGVDVDKFAANSPVVVDASAMMFPLTKLNDLPAGDYAVQAVYLQNRDINLPNAPGNLYSPVLRAKLDPAAGSVVKLVLANNYADVKPKDTPTHHYLHVPSKLLSDFHGRPMVYRVGVVLPTDFANRPNDKFALHVRVGGFGSRYTGAAFVRPDPRFVQIVLDGAGPFGDPYQVDSANNGPYGRALTEEVIPFVEQNYRCLGTPQSRFASGASTGGWVSLALQIFYPDFFNGCWSQCPDGVTFEAFELIDIYRDGNAYVNKFGFERPSKRTLDGDTMFTVRHESRLERVLGRGNRWELGGRDWASWNAAFGPRGGDGLPAPLWDNESGTINRAVVNHWEQYDLVKVLEKNWKAVGPKLGGKIHVWVGDADDYFLNNAVHRMKKSLAGKTNPASDAEILIDMRKGHSSGGWTDQGMLKAMAVRAGL